MYTINRSAAVIKPKQPFVDWINSLPGDDKLTLKQVTQDNVVILLPEIQRPGDDVRYLKGIYSEFFTDQLWAWYADKSYFPEKRDWELLQKWFDVEICSEVFDVEDGAVEKQEI